MNNKKMIFFMLILGCLLFYCCRPVEHWNTIRVVNNTNNKIYASIGAGRYGMSKYPDTVLPREKPSLIIVEAKKDNVFRSGPDWEYVIRQDNHQDTVSIYVFDFDTINTLGWDQVKNSYKVLKRYDLNINGLKKRQWTISYP